MYNMYHYMNYVISYGDIRSMGRILLLDISENLVHMD